MRISYVLPCVILFALNNIVTTLRPRAAVTQHKGDIIEPLRSLDENMTLQLLASSRQAKFPCHYITNNRASEYEISPRYDSKIRTLPSYNRPPSIYDIAIATLISPTESMFARLLEMAGRWSGPISVSVFIDDQITTEQVKLKIQKFKSDNALILGSDGRVLFHLVTDLMTARGKDVNLFPRNLMRNVAMDNAEANYMLVLDVDFAPSVGAHEKLTRHLQEVEEEANRNKKYALVVPAFEIFEKGDRFINNTVTTKEEMIAMIKMDPRTIRPFLQKSNCKAHAATNASRWYGANERYSILYKEDYEPYVVVRKDQDLPPFWEHFAGFGLNKLQWIEELNIAGFNFLVVPDVFVLQKWHEQYGLRRIRPFIADEYVSRFQKYLQKTYGHMMRAEFNLEVWRSTIYSEWLTYVVSQGQTTEYTSMKKMFELSDKREVEFVARCAYYTNTNHQDQFPPVDSITSFYNRVDFPHESLNNGSKQNLTSLFQEMIMTSDDKPTKPRMIANYYPRPSSNMDNDEVALATHSSSSTTKLENLSTQLEQWDGPASVALHVDSMEAIQALQDFLQTAPSVLLSKTSIHVMMEPPRKDGYPHNSLRNLAMENLGGNINSFFVALDVDFIPAKNTHAGLKALLQSDSQLRSELEGHHRVFVLPAFEVFPPPGKEMATRDMLPTSKKQLYNMVTQGTAEGFHQSRYPPGHGPTNFSKWFQEDSHASFYNIDYEDYFEPYVLGYKSPELPKYWPHYRGYGFNKIDWFDELNRAKYAFGVLRDFYVIHLNHPSNAHLGQLKANSRKRKDFYLFLDQKYPDTSQHRSTTAASFPSIPNIHNVSTKCLEVPKLGWGNMIYKLLHYMAKYKYYEFGNGITTDASNASKFPCVVGPFAETFSNMFRHVEKCQEESHSNNCTRIPHNPMSIPVGMLLDKRLLELNGTHVMDLLNPKEHGSENSNNKSSSNQSSLLFHQLSQTCAVHVRIGDASFRKNNTQDKRLCKRSYAKRPKECFQKLVKELATLCLNSNSSLYLATDNAPFANYVFEHQEEIHSDYGRRMLFHQNEHHHHNQTSITRMHTEDYEDDDAKDWSLLRPLIRDWLVLALANKSVSFLNSRELESAFISSAQLGFHLSY